MYIKIVRNGVEKLYHCYSSTYTPNKDSTQLVINFFNGGYIVENLTYNSSNEIYFMNDFGKTIDRKRWDD
jgi:hypothetical protein